MLIKQPLVPSKKKKKKQPLESERRPPQVDTPLPLKWDSPTQGLSTFRVGRYPSVHIGISHKKHNFWSLS